MEIVRLFNPNDAPIAAMFNGTPYLLPARGYAYVPRVAAEHFVAYYRARGVTIASDDAPTAIEHEGEDAPDDSADDTSDATAEEVAGASAVVCEVCQKDFSDRERPAVALARHKRLAHPA
jgi:hypothetical protein